MTFKILMTKEPSMIAFMLGNGYGKQISSKTKENTTEKVFNYKSRRIAITEINGKVDLITCGTITITG